VTNTLQEIWRFAKILAEHQRGGSSSPLSAGRTDSSRGELEVKNDCAFGVNPGIAPKAFGADPPSTLAEQLFDAVNKSSYDKGFDQVFHVMLG
jgi:hypothetical protein